MKSQCNKCGYPAQMVACPECGGSEYISAKAAGDRWWWKVLVAVIGLQGVYGVATLLYSFATYHSGMKSAVMVGATSSAPMSADPWVNFGRWLQAWRVVDAAGIAALLLVLVLIGLAVVVPRWRSVLSTLAAVMFLLYTAAGIMNVVVNYRSLP